VNDFERACRDICDDNEFVRASNIIAANIRDDLKHGRTSPSEVIAELAKINHAIGALSLKAERRLSGNLEKLYGNAAEAARALLLFRKALTLEVDGTLSIDDLSGPISIQRNIKRELRERPRRAVIVAVWQTFLKHDLPIAPNPKSELAQYYQALKEETGFEWSVDTLTRDTRRMVTERWTLGGT
jgi:hypothetical protein